MVQIRARKKSGQRMRTSHTDAGRLARPRLCSRAALVDLRGSSSRESRRTPPRRRSPQPQLSSWSWGSMPTSPSHQSRRHRLPHRLFAGRGVHPVMGPVPRSHSLLTGSNLECRRHRILLHEPPHSLCPVHSPRLPVVGPWSPGPRRALAAPSPWNSPALVPM